MQKINVSESKMLNGKKMQFLAQLINTIFFAFDGEKIAAMLTTIAKSWGKQEYSSRPTWKSETAKFAQFLGNVLRGDYSYIPYSIITDGNQKLTVNKNGNKIVKKVFFLTYSTSPLVTCPGAGACKNFCYSIKAWCYPAAFFRQLQNTILTAYNFEIIATAFQERVNEEFKKHGRPVDFRLFVDGDFSSLTDIRNWMELLAKNKNKVSAYGYTKSLALMTRYAAKNTIPDNYLVNLSDGNKYPESMQIEFLGEKYVRGYFSVIPKDKIDCKDLPSGFDLFADKEYKKRAMAAAKEIWPNEKIFVCPGNCGQCTSIGHACGNDKFRDVRIVIYDHA